MSDKKQKEQIKEYQVIKKLVREAFENAKKYAKKDLESSINLTVNN